MAVTSSSLLVIGVSPTDTIVSPDVRTPVAGTGSSVRAGHLDDDRAGAGDLHVVAEPRSATAAAVSFESVIICRFCWRFSLGVDEPRMSFSG